MRRGDAVRGRNTKSEQRMRNHSFSMSKRKARLGKSLVKAHNGHV